jgi:hypothetical protein
MGGVADIFFSYSSADRERVRPIHDALEAQGFEVFWDQEVPPCVDWDTWIRQNLAKSKCAVVFWSATSIVSHNVRHEAVIANEQRKLVPVLLESLTADQFPMGLYTTQAVNLADWNGDIEHQGWSHFSREITTKLLPKWVQRQIDELEARLHTERAGRARAESWEATWKEHAEREAEARQDLERARSEAVGQAKALRSKTDELIRAKSELSQSLTDREARFQETERQISEWKEQIAKSVQAQQELKRERDDAIHEAAALRIRIDELSRSKSESEALVAELLHHLKMTSTTDADRKASAAIAASPARWIIPAVVVVLIILALLVLF